MDPEAGRLLSEVLLVAYRVIAVTGSCQARAYLRNETFDICRALSKSRTAMQPIVFKRGWECHSLVLLQKTTELPTSQRLCWFLSKRDPAIAHHSTCAPEKRNLVIPETQLLHGRLPVARFWGSLAVTKPLCL